MKLDKVFTGLHISSQGLGAQRKRMNAIATNLANAETTKTESGGPYKRKIVQLKARGAQFLSSLTRTVGSPLSTTHAGHLSQRLDAGRGGSEAFPLLEISETEDGAPARMVYDPGNPEANELGYVAMPNVNVVTEMVNMISASRAFEANVVAANAAKNMAKDSLEI